MKVIVVVLAFPRMSAVLMTIVCVPAFSESMSTPLVSGIVESSVATVVLTPLGSLALKVKVSAVPTS